MPTGSSNYPGSLDTFAPTRADGDLSGPDVVKHAAALGAIETELGVDPSGAAATVKARLDAVEASGAWIIPIPLFATPHTVSGGTWDASVHTAPIGYGFRQWPGGSTVTVGWDVGLYAGTWTLSLMAGKDAGRGKLTVKLDAVTVGTVDTYAAALSWDNIIDLTGIAVASSGKKRLTLVNDAKNASSSGFEVIAQFATLLRTA